MNENKNLPAIGENERLDTVNDRLGLIQKTDGLTFGTDALLLAGFIHSSVGRFSSGLEIGGGSGIISLLLLARERIDRIDCVEIQEEYADLIARNAMLNRLTERLTPICADIRNYTPGKEYEIVFANPPYMTVTGGKACEKSQKDIARHEVFGTIDELIGAAARLTKYGGSFYAVYRPDRLTDLISAMRKHKLEPKKLTFVCADASESPSCVLILGKRGGKAGMIVTPPLLIYESSDKTTESEDMKYILEHGKFPEKFGRIGRKG